MDTLTLNIDQNVIKKAEVYAENANTTVPKLIEEYLLSISSNVGVDNNNVHLGPITKQLAGIIKLNKDINHKEILTDALMEKYSWKSYFLILM